MNRLITGMRTRTNPGVGERGAVVVELVVMAPAVILVMMFLAWATIQPAADAEAMSAAKAAARAGSLTLSQNDAVIAAEGSVDRAFADACVSLSAEVDTSRWDEGWISVTVTCLPRSTGFEEIARDSSIERTWTERVQPDALAGRR